MGLLGWLLLIIGVMVAAKIFVWFGKRYGRNSTVRSLTSMSDFTASHFQTSDDGLYGIAIDESRQKICLYQASATHSATRILNYRDILEVEVAEDGAMVSRSSSGSMAARAIVGGVVFGGVGAVVGALSAKRKQEPKVRRIDLKIVVNDTARPNFSLNLLNIECDRGGPAHRVAMMSADEWMGRLKVAIRIADDAASLAQNAAAGVVSLTGVAEEISRLAQLRDQGLLTDGEFQQQKSRLLSFGNEAAEIGA